MADLEGLLVDVVGAAHVLTGDAISDDYTHDEALTVGAAAAARASCARARPPRSPPSCASPNEHRVPVTARGQRHRPVGRGDPARRTASSCRSSA